MSRETTGRRARQQAKLEERIHAAVSGVLEPGEKLQVVVYGQARPRSWVGAEILLGPLLAGFVSRYYFAAVSDRRLFLIALSRATGRPTKVEWAEPLAGIAVDEHREGVLWTRLHMRRRADGALVRLRTVRTMRAATREIAERLGAP